MVKIIYFSGIKNGYEVNKPRKAAELRVCNCVHGHQNCKCDGKTGKKIRWNIKDVLNVSSTTTML